MGLKVRKITLDGEVTKATVCIKNHHANGTLTATGGYTCQEKTSFNKPFQVRVPESFDGEPPQTVPKLDHEKQHQNARYCQCKYGDVGKCIKMIKFSKGNERRRSKANMPSVLADKNCKLCDYVVSQVSRLKAPNYNMSAVEALGSKVELQGVQDLINTMLEAALAAL